MCVHESKEGEARDILFVINESNRTHYRSIIPEPSFKDPVLHLDELIGLMETMTFYSHKRDGRIVGVAALEEKAKGSGQIHWVYVLPEFQRIGVGTSLVRRIESEAERRDINRLTVITARRADWARRFYLGLGYQLLNERSTPEGGVARFEKVL